MSKRLPYYLYSCLILGLGTKLLAQETPVHTILATPKGGAVFYQGKTVRTEELNTAVRKARPGDTVFILPGTYQQQLVISKGGNPAKPITISGVDSLSIFSCNDLPADDGDPAIKVSVSSGLVFRGLSFENCWPAAIEILDSDHIAVSSNQFTSGKYPITVRYRSSHHILVEDNQWNQSESFAANTKPAAEFEQDPSLKNYIGAFLYLDGVAGDIIMRRNRIKNAYAAFSSANGKSKSKESLKNLQIYDNTFEHVLTEAINFQTPADNPWMKNNKVIPEDQASTKQTNIGNFQAANTPYVRASIPTEINIQKKIVHINLDKKDSLKGLGPLSFNTKDGKVLSSSPCNQKPGVLSCTFTEIPDASGEFWLEVEEETAISLWGSELSNLKLVRKPKR